MVLAVIEEERREELKVEAEAVQDRGLPGLDRGQNHAQNLAPDQNLDLESPDPGQPVDLDPGVAPRGLEVVQQGQDLGQPSPAAGQGRALAVQQDLGPRVEQGPGQGVPGEDQGQEVQQSRDQEVQRNQGQEVQGDQDLEVLLSLVLGVQQGQDRQAHQDQGLHELDWLEGCYTRLLFVPCGPECPYIIS